MPSSDIVETGGTPVAPAGEITQIIGDPTFRIRKIDGSLFCQEKQSGSQWTAVSGLTDAVSIVVNGYGNKCAVKTDGSAVCLGNNNYGQLDDGTIVDKEALVVVLGLGEGTTATIYVSKVGYRRLKNQFLNCLLTRRRNGDNRRTKGREAFSNLHIHRHITHSIGECAALEKGARIKQLQQ